MKQLENVLSRVESPQVFFSKLWKRVPGHTRWTFLSAMILGLGVHAYFFTNKLPNHDDIIHMFYAHYGTASGRWLLPYMYTLDGNFSVPWLTGMLSLLCLAGTAGFFTSVLRIRRPLACVCTSAVLVSFPTITSTLAYTFTADCYFSGLLLAAFSAYIVVKFPRWWGMAIGAVSLTLSLGIYQSYLGIAVALMVGGLLFDTLDGEMDIKALLIKGVKMVLTLGVGLALYMVMVKLTTMDGGLVNYMGISTMGQISLTELPGLIRDTYQEYFQYFIRNERNVHFGFMKYVFCIVSLCTAGMGVQLLVKKRPGLLKTGLAVVLVVLYPLVANMIYIMCPRAEVHNLMLYGYCCILVAPLALLEYAAEPLGEGDSVPGRALYSGLSWVIVASLVLTAWSYAITDNKAYLKSEVSWQMVSNYSNRLVARVEAHPDYEPGMLLVLVGSQVKEETLHLNKEMDQVKLTGILDLQALRSSYAYGGLVHMFTAYPGLVQTGVSQTAMELWETEEVKAMPVYPAEGSIKMIDGNMVVKLNEKP